MMNIFSKKVSKLIYLFLFIFIYCQDSLGMAMLAENEPSTPVFIFKNNSLLLLPDYKNNRSQLVVLDKLVNEHKADLKDCYFSIISYVRQADARDLMALNKASLHGSVVRAYIRQHFRLPQEEFTFQIDTSGNDNNITRVTLCRRPVPTCISMINYSLNNNPRQIEIAMSAYPEIPYLGRKCAGEEADEMIDPEWNQIIMEGVHKTDSLYSIVEQMKHERSDTITLVDTILIYEEKNEIVSGRKLPFLGVKTNLMYWAGFTPEMKWKQVLPNLALELYFGNHWSLEFDGAYTRRLVNGNHSKRYAFSAFGAEGRYWLCGNRLYQGFYGGVYTDGGEFDVTPKVEDDKGFTGEYVGAGLSVGYTRMFSAWFGLEVGVRGGFRHVSYDTYHRHSSHYYFESTKYKNGVRLNGVFLNAIFRFNTCKN